MIESGNSSCNSSLISIENISKSERIRDDDMPTSSYMASELTSHSREDNRIYFSRAISPATSSSVIDSDEEQCMQRLMEPALPYEGNFNNNNNDDDEENNYPKYDRNRIIYKRNARDRKIQNARRDQLLRGRNRKGFKGRSIQLSSIRAIRGPQMFNCEERIRPYGERLVRKSGNNNNLGRLEMISRYGKDIFTTMVDLSWGGVLTLTVFVYLTIWIIFGFAYWGFAIVNNDYHRIKGPSIVNPFNETLVAESLGDPCVSQVYGFVSAFLFSLESSTTVGYGSRAISTACPMAITCLSFQCVISAIFDTWVIGMCYIRMARPDARRKTTLFANNAVICTRDGQKCLLIRVANLRKSLLMGVSIRARMITLREPNNGEEAEGHHLMLEQHELKFTNSSNTMLTAPIEYCHVIDKDSPLKNIPINYFSTHLNWFEIVVIMSGIVEATGLTMHAQASYLSTEIKYRHRFIPVVSKNSDRYIVDFNRFHETTNEPLPCTCRNPSCEERWHVGNYPILVQEKLYSVTSLQDDVFTKPGNNIEKPNINNNLIRESQS